MTLALVTGAPGWLGTALVEALVKGASYPALTTEPRSVRCVVQPGVDTGPVEQLGAQVVAAVALVDRGESAAPEFERRGIPYLPMVTYRDLGIQAVGLTAGGMDRAPSSW